MKQPAPIYAALSGDLVGSSKLSSAQSARAMDWLREAGAEFGDLFAGTVIGRLDTFRHDSWQLLLAGPELGVRAAVFLRASLKLHADADTKFDTRVSIGVGPLETVSKRRISDSRGPAFTISGKNLDGMDHDRLAFGADILPEWLTDAIARAALPLLDCVVSDWTPVESRAARGALKGWTQEQTATDWPVNPDTGKPITRQAVGLSLDRAHWGAVDGTLEWLESRTKQFLELA